MKKFCLPLFIIMTMLSHNAWGGNCAANSGTCVSNNDCLQGENIFFQCDASYCYSGATITINGRASIRQGYGVSDTGGVYECNVGNDDAWQRIADITTCTNSPLQANATGAVKVLTTQSQAATETAANQFRQYVVARGCFAYVCPQGKIAENGNCVTDMRETECTTGQGSWTNGACVCGSAKIWDRVQKKCVENSVEATCRLSGGNWNGTECTCTETGLRQKEPYRDVCECTAGPNYTWQNGQCRNGQGRTQTEQANAESWDRQAQSANRSTCEASGGTYSRRKCSCTAENTQVVSGKCECNSGYKWKNESSKREGCEPTDSTLVSQACNAAATKGQAQWHPYPSPGQCICNESGYVLDVNAGECKPTVERAACDVLTQQNKARWNTAQKACVCSQTGYEFDGNSCVETAEGAAARKANELATAKAKIENVHSKLKKTQDGFKVSAWKNEDGNFNTARLASDSIAGVVVGTAGGLLTSKIVKKNQVEDGFEDIQCTIGGQTVAGWGDEFSVGNQM